MTPRKPPLQFSLAVLFVVVTLLAATLSLPGVLMFWVAFAAMRFWAADGDIAERGVGG